MGVEKSRQVDQPSAYLFVYDSDRKDSCFLPYGRPSKRKGMRCQSFAEENAQDPRLNPKSFSGNADSRLQLVELLRTRH